MKALIGLGVTTFATLIAATAVYAAKAAPPSASSASSASWTGFYAGANLGDGWSTVDPVEPLTATIPGVVGIPGVSSPNVPVTPPLNGSTALGITGGAQVGYNWQIKPSFVVGFEADLQALQAVTGRTSSAPFTSTGVILAGAATETTTGTVGSSFDAKISWFGTVRGRMGTVVNGLLFYGTGGLAYGGVTLKSSTSANGTSSCSDVIGGAICSAFGFGTVVQSTTSANADSARVNLGWAVGAGVEGKLTGKWSWKAEYLHVDLGSVSAGTSATGIIRATFREDIARLGLNYAFATYPR